jgi:hypothetical protein
MPQNNQWEREFAEKFCNRDINATIIPGSCEYFCCSQEFCTGHEQEISELKSFISSQLTQSREAEHTRLIELVEEMFPEDDKETDWASYRWVKDELLHKLKEQ